MGLFQKSVEKKYLNELDLVLIDKKYKAFQAYFGKLSIQENIRNSKEEQFQEGFLRELFVSIFEYTPNPQPNFNLTTEMKNILATLSTIASIWKQEYRTRNAIEIASQGGMLYDKFVGFVEDLEAIGNRINQTQVVYDQAMNKLKSGRGNLINRAEKLRLLGVKTTKKLSRELSENDEDVNTEPEDGLKL